MKILLQRLIAWWAFLHAIMLLTLPLNILFSSKDGVLGKEPGLLDRGLFLWRFTQLTARSRAFLVLCDAAHFVGGAVAAVGPPRHLAMAVECA